jgi:hypothetical protein
MADAWHGARRVSIKLARPRTRRERATQVSFSACETGVEGADARASAVRGIG